MSERMKPLSEVVSSLLSDLEQRVKTRIDLTERVRAALPGPEKDHVLSVTYRGETLIVIADSAAWCAHIRYAQQTLFERLQGGEMQFTKLKVKVGRKEH
jgi:hypothetical protein